MEWEDFEGTSESWLDDSERSECMRSSEENESRRMSAHAMVALNEFREMKLLTDATVSLDDGSTYHVHRAILSASSPYFRSLFTSTVHSLSVVHAYLPEITPVCMQGILEYVYLRSLTITPLNVCQILITADYLGIDGLQQFCCDYLKEHMTPNNCIGMMIFARAYFCHELENFAFSFILRNYIEVALKSEEMLSLSLEDFTVIVGHDLLNAKSEETVWKSVLRWVSADEENRKKCIDALLRNIRLGLLDTQYLLEKVKDHEYVMGNPSCRPIIIETLRFLYDLEMIAQKETEVSTPAIARPRIPHEILFAIGGWSGGSPTNFIESYDTRADRWIKVREVDPRGPRAYHGTAVLGHNIYVIGGFDGMDYFNSCRCFNSVTKQWKEIAPMNAKRCYVSVTVLDNEIYALGGYDGHHRQNSGEKYNCIENQWTLIARMNMERSDASATTLNGKIYITGGFNGQECMNSVEVYSPDTNQWTMIAPMRSRRSGVSCTAYHGFIYVVGGFNGVSRMCSGEKYNPYTDTWSPIPDMYNPRSNFAMEVIEDLLFAIGGFNGVTTIFHVECFDDNLNEWFEATDMNLFRSALSACVVRDLPNYNDYIHPNRDRLMEEKRLKLIAQERIREEAEDAAEAVAVVNAVQAVADVEEEENEMAPPGEIENEHLDLNQILHMRPQNLGAGILVALMDAEGGRIALIEADDEDQNNFDVNGDMEMNDMDNDEME